MPPFFLEIRERVVEPSTVRRKFFSPSFSIKIALLVVFPSLLALQPAYAISQLQNEINIISTVISQAVSFVTVNNATNGYNLSNFSNLGVAAQYSLINSLTVNNTTGKIELVVSTNSPDASRTIRGLKVSLTPKYYSPDDQSYHTFNRVNGDGSHKIETWSCSIDNSVAGADFSTFRILGRTYNTFIQSETLDPDLENALSKYCSNTTIITVAG